jgi:cell division protein FtsB
MSNRSKSPEPTRGISVRWLLVVSTSFIVILTVAPTLQRYFAQRAQINALHTQINDANNALDEAKKELAKWNDPNYIASQARTRLHFVFPGERQYAIQGLPDNASNSDSPASQVSNQIPSGLPWYGKLMASITATNQTR